MSIMSNDQQGISSKLRFMDPQTLRQYGEMHKANPYIFPLVFQESQNRQRLNMNQQAAQGMQPQPKVNEQALAQMASQQLPEDQGIATLAAPNMQQMADGGIAGYDDADFVSRSEPVVMMAGGGHIPRYQGNPQDGSLVRGRTSWEDELERLQAPPQESSALGRGIVNAFTYSSDFEALVQSAKAKQARGIPLTAPEARALQSEEAPTATKKESPFEQERARNMARVANEGYTRGDPRALPTMPSAKEQLSGTEAPKVDAAPTADTARQPRPNTGQETPRAPAVPEQTAAQRYAEMQKGLAPDRTKIDEGIASLSESMRKTAKGELEDFDKEVAERGVAFKGREERLAKQEEGLSKRKDENMGLALLEAGLAIMSTPGSLATAIGKGAQTGLKTYSAGLKDLRAAQEKMDDARDQIEEFRRNEANMTAKERRQFKTAINRTETDIEKLGLQAAEKMYGYKRSDAETIFKADTQERLTDKEIDAKRDIAAMQERGQSARSAAQIAATLNTPDRVLFDQLMKKNGNDAVKALEAFKVAKGDKFDVRTSYADYLKAFAGKEGMTPPMSMSAYAAQFGATLPR